MTRIYSINTVAFLYCRDLIKCELERCYNNELMLSRMIRGTEQLKSNDELRKLKAMENLQIQVTNALNAYLDSPTSDFMFTNYHFLNLADINHIDLTDVDGALEDLRVLSKEIFNALRTLDPTYALCQTDSLKHRALNKTLDHIREICEQIVSLSLMPQTCRTPREFAVM